MEYNLTTEMILPYLVYKYPKIFNSLRGNYEMPIRCGIFDCKDTEYVDGSIYTLVRFKKFQKGKFKLFLDRIQSHKGYVKDYLYGDLLHDFYHMIVFNIDTQIHKSFIEGAYSKMYANPDKIFYSEFTNVQEYRKGALNILKRDKTLQTKLASELNMTYEDLQGVELCAKVNPLKEIFNYDNSIILPESLKQINEY